MLSIRGQWGITLQTLQLEIRAFSTKLPDAMSLQCACLRVAAVSADWLKSPVTTGWWTSDSVKSSWTVPAAGTAPHSWYDPSASSSACEWLMSKTRVPSESLNRLPLNQHTSRQPHCSHIATTHVPTMRV